MFALGLLCLLAGAPAGSEGAVAEAARPRVAVLDFRTSSPPGPLDGLKKAIPGMLLADLEDPRWTLVEREEIQAILQELKLSEAAGDPATLLRVGRMVQATHLVTGNFTEVRGRFVFSARMFSTETTELVATFSASGTADRFDELTRDFATSARRRLAVLAGGPASPPAEPRADRPASPDATPARLASSARAPPGPPAGPSASPRSTPRSTTGPAAAAPTSPHGRDRAPAGDPGAGAGASGEPAFALDDAVLYGNALAAADAGERSRAVEQLSELQRRSPGLAAARRDLDRLTRVHRLPEPGSP